MVGLRGDLSKIGENEHELIWGEKRVSGVWKNQSERKKS